MGAGDCEGRRPGRYRTLRFLSVLYHFTNMPDDPVIDGEIVALDEHRRGVNEAFVSMA
jgi:hypothetical protein